MQDVTAPVNQLDETAFDPVPNLQEADAFLKCLDSEARTFTFQTFDDNKERAKQNKATLGRDPFAKTLHGTLEQHASHLYQLQCHGAGVFVTINATDGTGRKAANITRVRSVFVDLDGASLEPVLEAKAQPQIIVESSPGRWHAYWLVVDMQLDAFKPAQQALIEKFNSDKSVCDLPRVMRLPGFWHLKDQPFQTRLVRPVQSNQGAE